MHFSYLKSFISIIVASLFWISQINGQNTGTTDTAIVLNTQYVLFESASHILDTIAISQIAAIARGDTIYKYALTGHTDSDGSDKYNMTLSENRVRTVYNYLTQSLGLDSTRVVTSFEGELKPLAPNNIEEGKKRNRRVSIEKFLPVRIRYISGRIRSDKNRPIKNGHIYMQSRYYRDSVSTDSLGRFIIGAPDDSFVKLNATAGNHFYIDTLLKVTPSLALKGIDVKVPFLENDQRYRLPEMFFVGDQDVLLFRSLSSLSALTNTMVNSDVCAIIEGHVNLPNQPPQKPGTFSFNLSVARAMKIKNHLIAHGVDSLRINPLGFSNWYMSYPYAITEREQELNRRVEMVIKDCKTLFDFTQQDLIIPDKIGTTKRLINIK